MSCHCDCHTFNLSPLKPPCYGCAGNIFHSPADTDTPPITRHNVHMLLGPVAIVDAPEYGAYRYTAWTLDPDPQKRQQLGVAMSYEMVQTVYPNEIKGEVLRAFAQECAKAYAHKRPHWVRERLAAGAPYLSHHADAAAYAWTLKPSLDPATPSGHKIVADIHRSLPGLRQQVDCPDTALQVLTGEAVVRDETCPRRFALHRMIVHLNDEHRWDRGRVADWLESLDVDLTFPSEPPVELPRAKADQILVIISDSYSRSGNEARRRRRRPRDWVFVNSSGKDSMALRGRRGFQYVVLDEPHERLLQEILSFEAVEVGEEDALAPFVEAVQQLQQQQTQTQTLADMLAKEMSWWSSLMSAKKSLIEYTLAGPENLEGWKCELILLDEVPPCQSTSNAKKLIDNLAALKHTPCYESTLWLSDPHILGEHLPSAPKPSTKTPASWDSPTQDTPFWVKPLNH